MSTEETLYNQLQENNSLMKDKLRWASRFKETPIEFETPGGTIIAIPEVNGKTPSPYYIENFIKEEHLRKEKSIPPQIAHLSLFIR